MICVNLERVKQLLSVCDQYFMDKVRLAVNKTNVLDIMVTHFCTQQTA